MKYLKHVLRGYAASLDLAKKRGQLYRLEFEPDTQALVVLAAAQEIKNSGEDMLETAYSSAAIRLMEYSADLALEQRARMDALMHIAGRLGYFRFAGENGEIYVSAAPATPEFARDLMQDLQGLDRLFRRDFGVGLIWSACDAEAGFAVAEKRVAEAREYFIDNKGPWIENFMAALQDDISRDSLHTYLRQRILAKIFWGADICYPVAPPESTAAWRMERENAPQNYPVLKNTRGEVIHDIYYRYVYTYDQYSIPGQAEVQPGDAVIDAGAFVGDTSFYFSRKAGPTGKVWAFEIFSDSVACGQENMRSNGAANVEYVNAALSDKTGKACLIKDELCASQSKIVFDGAETEDCIDAIALDDFRQRSGPIQFIKADIEGSEMAMLHGARETIAKDGPTCAICVYHKRDDFWEIPEFLAALRPDYKFWFRCEAEPVVFARCTAG